MLSWHEFLSTVTNSDNVIAAISAQWLDASACIASSPEQQELITSLIQAIADNKNPSDTEKKAYALAIEHYLTCKTTPVATPLQKFTIADADNEHYQKFISALLAQDFSQLTAPTKEQDSQLFANFHEFSQQVTLLAKMVRLVPSVVREKEDADTDTSSNVEDSVTITVVSTFNHENDLSSIFIRRSHQPMSSFYFRKPNNVHDTALPAKLSIHSKDEFVHYHDVA